MKEHHVIPFDHKIHIHRRIAKNYHAYAEWAELEPGRIYLGADEIRELAKHAPREVVGAMSNWPPGYVVIHGMRVVPVRIQECIDCSWKDGGKHGPEIS